MSEHCMEMGIPEHLWKSGRPIVDISSTDAFYRRIQPAHFPDKEKTKKVPGNAFPLKNDSYNTGSLSQEPEDVLYSIRPDVAHYTDNGIIKFDLSKIWNEGFEYSGGKEIFKCRFVFVHRPENCMYPHAEIEVYINDQLKNPVESKTAKNALRLILYKNHEIVRYPPEFQERMNSEDGGSETGDEIDKY